MREFLSKINGRLVLDENFAVPLQREYDEHLMDIVIESHLLTPKETVLFNYCQDFLEVYTISNISEANGQYVDEAYLRQQPQHTSILHQDMGGMAQGSTALVQSRHQKTQNVPRKMASSQSPASSLLEIQLGSNQQRTDLH
jgi:hypothetical protein